MVGDPAMTTIDDIMRSSTRKYLVSMAARFAKSSSPFKKNGMSFLGHSRAHRTLVPWLTRSPLIP